MIAVGQVGRRPLCLAVAASPACRVVVDAKLCGKLLDEEHLPRCRAILLEVKKKFVPSRETADEWREAFETFRRSRAGDSVQDCFDDFAALLYGRTKLKEDEPGKLMVSSVRTYLSYIASGRLEFLRYGDSFRAVDTQAGSIGSQRVAPVVSNDQLQTILSYVHSGAAEELKTRLGMYLQCYGGGRTVDVRRLRQNGLEWAESGVTIDAFIWRWAKNIQGNSQVKYCPTVPEVLALFGSPPVSAPEWRQLCEKDEYPLEEYDAQAVNAQLAHLCPGSGVTSTSLRDLCHKVLKEKYGANANKIVVHTPHRSTKALMSTYLGRCPVGTAGRKPPG